MKDWIEFFNDRFGNEFGIGTETSVLGLQTASALEAAEDPEPFDIDEPLNTTPDYTSAVSFSTDNILGLFDGTTQGDLDPGDPQIIDFTADPKVTKDGVDMFPINSAFGYNVEDFVGAEQKTFDGDPEYEEGWAGDLPDDGGLVVSDAPTDWFKTPALMGTWAAGLGGNSVKASTEHYGVMQAILSDQRYPGDPDALYPLDDDLYVVGGEYDGMRVADVIDTISDKNGDGVVDIRDVLSPNETTITENIAVGDDYSVTLKDDGKLLFRWGNMIKKPNDIRITSEMELPDEWVDDSPEDSSVRKLFMVTQAELVIDHTITNNPNDQVRPEGLENEAAIGRLPDYTELPDGTWVSNDDFYAGDGTFYPAGTVLRDPALAAELDGTLVEKLGTASSDLTMGYTNAWYTTLDREPFESIVVDDEYEMGPRWRLKPNKYGQDLPGVEIPIDPSSPPPPTHDEIKYETGAPTQTVLNLLDWDGVSPLSISAGWQNNAGTVDENGLALTDNFDVAYYIKGDQKPAELRGAELVLSYEEVTVHGKGATAGGTAEDDILAGLGDNELTGGEGADMFVLAYGTHRAENVESSTITDFETGVDKITLIDHDVNPVTLGALLGQHVDGDNLHISIGGHEYAVLEGVDEELEEEDFLILNVQKGGIEEDALEGTAYADKLVGTEGGDDIYALAGDDTVDGGDGRDVIYAGDGDDKVLGGLRVDQIFGEAGADTIKGGKANDYLDGGLGDDRLIGGNGDDTVIGGEGDDELQGRRGDDVMTGGEGADVFTFKASAFGNDTITDFEDGTDMLDLTELGLDYSDFTKTTDGSDTLLTLTADPSNSIRLIGVNEAVIDGNDFFDIV